MVVQPPRAIRLVERARTSIRVGLTGSGTCRNLAASGARRFFRSGLPRPEALHLADRVRSCLDPTLARTSAHRGYGTGTDSTESGLGAETLGGGKRIIY